MPKSSHEILRTYQVDDPDDAALVQLAETALINRDEPADEILQRSSFTHESDKRVGQALIALVRELIPARNMRIPYILATAGLVAAAALAVLCLRLYTEVRTVKQESSNLAISALSELKAAQEGFAAKLASTQERYAQQLQGLQSGSQDSFKIAMEEIAKTSRENLALVEESRLAKQRIAELERSLAESRKQ